MGTATSAFFLTAIRGTGMADHWKLDHLTRDKEGYYAKKRYLGGIGSNLRPRVRVGLG